MEKQIKYRVLCRKLKWSEGIKYKYIAENILNMNYHAFINWLNGDFNLGLAKIQILDNVFKKYNYFL